MQCVTCAKSCMPSLLQMLWSFSHCGFKDDALLEVVDDMAHNLAFTMQVGFHGLLQASSYAP